MQLLGPTRWDRRIFRVAAGASALSLGLVWLITATTDEGGLTWAARMGRAVPLAPLCATLAVWTALAASRARGETLALAALGRAPLQVAGAAVLGAAVVVLAAAAAIAFVPSIGADGFFPTATRATAWRWVDGAFVDRWQGLRVLADGTPVVLDREAWASNALSVPRYGRLAAATTTLLAGAALPLLLADVFLAPSSRQAARASDRAAAVLLGVLTIVLTVVLFQAAAAARAPVFTAVVPPAGLLAWTIRRYRRAS